MRPTIHPSWDAEKVTAHLADLAADLAKYEYAADALREAADEQERLAGHRERQISKCLAMFAEPRPTTTTDTSPSDGAREDGRHG